MKHDSVLSLIGKTPLVRICNLVPDSCAEVWAKLEGFNPGGSVKDRIALSMIETAERDGTLKKGMVIIEPTSGNTGIGLALVAVVKDYDLILTMPETMSMERRKTMKAFGAKLILTDGSLGMMGAMNKAFEIHKQNPGYFMPLQFENPANPEIHRITTAPEIIDALGCIPDAFVAGVGTGGTITGVGEVLKNKKPEIHVTAVEPASSAVLSGGEPGRHKIPGIGAGFFPGVLNTEIYDEVLTVTDKDAKETSVKLARHEGILAGVSSGAAMWAAQQVARALGKGKKVVVILPDRGERYLSTGLYES